MKVNKPFTNGITSFLYGQWTLQLKSPMCIRGQQPAFLKSKREGQSKGRMTEIDFLYLYNEDQRDAIKDNRAYSQVTDFNYDFTVDQNRLGVQYAIPASSIRGALRNAALRSYIPPGGRNLFDVAGKKDQDEAQLDDLIQTVKTELKQAQSNWSAILSLFGNAFDVTGKEEDDIVLTWAGRMRLSTKLVAPATPALTIGAKSVTPEGYPQNMQGHITTGSPLDRVTMAAREGGLHSRIEMSEGQKFTIKFFIRNFCKNDLDLLEFWQQEVNAGFLRFGGLQSQRRGLCEIETHEYSLYAPVETELGKKLKDYTADTALPKNMFLATIWVGKKLDLNQMKALPLDTIEALQEDN